MMGVLTFIDAVIDMRIAQLQDAPKRQYKEAIVDKALDEYRRGGFVSDKNAIKE